MEDLATPPNTLVQIRWKEPYVSQGLNKKLHGLIPAGVIRGGKLAISLLDSSVTVQADPDTGDSVYSFIDANNHQMTFRQAGDVVLDLDVGALPGTTAYIGLDVNYSVSAQTEVKWRGYSQAEVDADPTIVVLGSAIVPGVAAPIPLSDLSEDRRRTAWQNISHYMRDAAQVIRNGAFELANDSAITAPDDNFWPFWDYPEGQETGLAMQITGVGSPQVGEQHLRMVLTGNATQEARLPHEGFYAVRGGGTAKAKFWIKGDALTPGPGAGGHMGLRIRVTNDNPDDVVQTIYVEDLTLSGTFAYQEIEQVFRLHDAAQWIRVDVFFDDNGNSSTGTIYFDDIRLFIEQPATDDGCVEGYGPLHEGAITARSIDIPKAPGVAASMYEFIENLLTLRWRSGQEWHMKRRLLDDFLLNFVNGGLEIGNLIESLGGSRIGSHVEAAQPRIKTPFPAYTTGRYVLIHEMTNLAGQADVRFYVTDQSDISGRTADTFSIVVNAVWDGNTQTWTYDSTASNFYALRVDFTKSKVYVLVKDGNGAVDPWTDAEWEDGVESFRYLEMGRAASGRGMLSLLGQAIINSQLTQDGVEIAKVKGDVANNVTNAYTLLFEFESEVADRRVLRFYTQIGTGSTDLLITVNARWDDSQGVSGEWEVDKAGFDAHALYFTGGNTWLRLRSHSQADGDTWTSWDDLWMCNGDASNKDVEVDYRDGILQMTSPSTKTNPAWNGAITQDSLYAKNIVKAWAHIEITGSAGSRVVTVTDGFGWDSITLNASGRLELDFDEVKELGYAAVLTSRIGIQSTFWSNWNMGTGLLEIAAINSSTGIMIDIDADSNLYAVSVIVCGQDD